MGNARKSGRRTNNVIDDTKAYERDLKLQMDRLGLYTVDTPTDGSCMFHAISDQLYGDNGHNIELRHSACNYLEEHEDLYAGFIEDDQTFGQHVYHMRDPSTYGGHLELSALANITRHSIKVIQPNLIYVVTADNTSPPDLYVAYHNWEHYSSVRNKNGPHKGLPMVREQEGSSSSSNSKHTPSQQDTIDKVLQCLPAELQGKEHERLIAELLNDFDSDWESVVEYLLEHGNGITDAIINEQVDRPNEPEGGGGNASKSPKREFDESSGEDKREVAPARTRRAKKAQKKQEKSDKRRVTRSMAREEEEDTSTAHDSSTSHTPLELNI